MKLKFNTYLLFLGLMTGLTAFSVFAQQEQEEDVAVVGRGGDTGAYVSPYRVRFTLPESDLIGDIIHGWRGNPKEQSSYPHELWYSRKVLKRYGAWGPPARRFPPPEGLPEKSLQWQRERVVATAMRFIGYSYQHHHIPDWSPPADWPWLNAPSGHNGKGLDCSNFTSFVYNLALGIKISADVRIQAREREIPRHEYRQEISAEYIPKNGSYLEFIQSLRTGDLIYLVKRNGEAYHVMIWIGSIGDAPDGKPLIIDSTGVIRNHDGHGAVIPQGIYLRPFDEHSSYFKAAGHAIRLIK